MDTPLLLQLQNGQIRGTRVSYEDAIEEGGPQQTSMAVKRRNTRRAIRARVTRAAVASDINASMAEEARQRRKYGTKCFYRSN
ncbi:MAG TPA: hypothetical protein VME43_06445 [Bryobacteraceae bacterium]|nr:hypothetical protein [Bryobacteraceae bacterium]